MSECKFAVEAFHAYIESIGLSRPAGTLGELKAFKTGAEWQRSQGQAELQVLLRKIWQLINGAEDAVHDEIKAALAKKELSE